MTPHDDHSQRRQPLLIPVVITTALLTIIAMGGGYLLAEQRSGETVPAPDRESAITLLPVGEPCLERTQKMGRQFGADGELRQVLKVRTEKRTVIWICQDQTGDLFYHANKGGPDATWVENKTALFLDRVVHDGNGTFTATAPTDGTTFTLDSTRLIVRHTDGRMEEQDVVPE